MKTRKLTNDETNLIRCISPNREYMCVPGTMAEQVTGLVKARMMKWTQFTKHTKMFKLTRKGRKTRKELKTLVPTGETVVGQVDKAKNLSKSEEISKVVGIIKPHIAKG